MGLCIGCGRKIVVVVMYARGSTVCHGKCWIDGTLLVGEMAGGLDAAGVTGRSYTRPVFRVPGS